MLARKLTGLLIGIAATSSLLFAAPAFGAEPAGADKAAEIGVVAATSSPAGHPRQAVGGPVTEGLIGGLLNQADARSLPTSVTAKKVLQPGEIASPDDIITCIGETDRAHKSKATNLPNTHGWINCSAPVHSMSSRVFINRGSTEVGSSALLYNMGQDRIYGTANAPSPISGSYSGAITGYIIFPSGYVPASAQLYGQGQVAYLTY